MKYFSVFFLLLICCSCIDNTVKVEKTASPIYKQAIQFRDIKKPDSAFLYFNKAKDVFLQKKDSLMAAICMVNMGIIATDQGDNFGGMELSLNAIPYFDESKTPHHIYMVSNFNNLGIAAYNLKKYDQAIQFYNQSLSFTKDSLNSRLVQNNIANAYRQEKRYAEALGIYEHLLQQETNQVNYARVLANYALTKWLQDPKFNPVATFNTALNIRKKEADAWGQNASYSYFTDYYLQKRPDTALYYARKMLQVAKYLNSPDDQLVALKNLVKLSEADATKTYFDIYQRLADSLQLKRNAAKNQFALIRYETEKHKADNLKLQKENTERKFWIGALIVLIIVSAIATVLWYNKRKERLQLESQNAIKESELKTSKKVHDVVANGLYRIISEIENGELLSQEKLLDDMEHLYEQSRDISYDHKNQELIKSDFENTIKALLWAFATENTKVVISGNTIEAWVGVGPKLKYELRYILQELMVNMKKHSNASAVAIRFERLNDQLKVYYTDNGIGLPANHIYGNGLHNTESRIKSLGGKLIFAGSEEGGVKIQLLFPTV